MTGVLIALSGSLVLAGVAYLIGFDRGRRRSRQWIVRLTGERNAAQDLVRILEKQNDSFRRQLKGKRYVDTYRIGFIRRQNAEIELLKGELEKLKQAHPKAVELLTLRVRCEEMARYIEETTRIESVPNGLSGQNLDVQA